MNNSPFTDVKDRVEGCIGVSNAAGSAGYTTRRFLMLVQCRSCIRYDVLTIEISKSCYIKRTPHPLPLSSTRGRDRPTVTLIELNFE